MNYMDHVDTSYLDNFESFFNHRRRYFNNENSYAVSYLRSKIFPRRSDIDHSQRMRSLVALDNTSAKVIITTANKNRASKLRSAYLKLLSQKGGIDWHWLIIDNGSSDDSVEEVASWQDSRVSLVEYPEITGCAFPVRNFAFDIANYAFTQRKTSASWVLNIDSDDQLYDEYSLMEIYKVAKKSDYTKKEVALVHGFAVWETHDQFNRPIISSCPAYIDNTFPAVTKMSEIFDKGLIVLAAMIPLSTYQWLRYPNEFSFEDDGLNQKIMLHAIRNRQDWLYTDYPIILKGYSGDTMINRNNKLGDSNMTAVIGTGHRVTGIRAQIVNHLRQMRDYYLINGL